MSSPLHRDHRFTPAGRVRLWVAAVALTIVPLLHASPKTIVFFGDSLTAGYGLDDPAAESFPGRIEARIEQAHLPYRVVNAGLSGETTAGGLRRVDWVLRQPIDVFVLALGGNDGLRGIDPSVTRANLQGIVDKVRARNPATRIVLVGMMMPPSMGLEYADQFAQVFPDVARKNSLRFIPFLLEGVGGHAELNQSDGIHPTARGHALLADTVWKTLEPLLAERPAEAAKSRDVPDTSPTPWRGRSANPAGPPA